MLQEAKTPRREWANRNQQKQKQPAETGTETETSEQKQKQKLGYWAWLVSVGNERQGDYSCSKHQRLPKEHAPTEGLAEAKLFDQDRASPAPRLLDLVEDLEEDPAAERQHVRPRPDLGDPRHLAVGGGVMLVCATL